MLVGYLPSRFMEVLQLTNKIIPFLLVRERILVENLGHNITSIYTITRVSSSPQLRRDSRLSTSNRTYGSQRRLRRRQRRRRRRRDDGDRDSRAPATATNQPLGLPTGQSTLHSNKRFRKAAIHSATCTLDHSLTTLQSPLPSKITIHVK